MIILDLAREYWLIYKWQKESEKASVPEKWKLGKKGNVLLINGWNESWYFLRLIGDYLNNLGYKILVPEELGKNLFTIEEGTRLVKKFIGDTKCTIVAHSKGGLLGLNLINESSQFKKLISIATPYQGTLWGYLGYASLAEMKWGKYKLDKKSTKLAISIRPKFDNHVIPGKGSILVGAKNIQIDIVGHTRILDDNRTFKAIEEELD